MSGADGKTLEDWERYNFSTDLPTDEEGNFQISHLLPGRYWVYDGNDQRVLDHGLSLPISEILQIRMRK